MIPSTAIARRNNVDTSEATTWQEKFFLILAGLLEENLKVQREILATLKGRSEQPALKAVPKPSPSPEPIKSIDKPVEEKKVKRS